MVTSIKEFLAILKYHLSTYHELYLYDVNVIILFQWKWETGVLVVYRRLSSNDVFGLVTYVSAIKWRNQPNQE